MDAAGSAHGPSIESPRLRRHPTLYRIPLPPQLARHSRARGGPTSPTLPTHPGSGISPAAAGAFKTARKLNNFFGEPVPILVGHGSLTKVARVTGCRPHPSQVKRNVSLFSLASPSVVSISTSATTMAASSSVLSGSDPPSMPPIPLHLLADRNRSDSVFSTASLVSTPGSNGHRLSHATSREKLNQLLGDAPLDVSVAEILRPTGKGLDLLLASTVPLCYFLAFLLKEKCPELLFFVLDAVYSTVHPHELYALYVASKTAPLELNLTHRTRMEALSLVRRKRRDWCAGVVLEVREQLVVAFEKFVQPGSVFLELLRKQVGYTNLCSPRTLAAATDIVLAQLRDDYLVDNDIDSLTALPTEYVTRAAVIVNKVDEFLERMGCGDDVL